jgi:hypothetical protein
MHMHNDLHERARQLAEIHAAPSWLWPALAAELVARGWTVEAAANWCMPYFGGKRAFRAWRMEPIGIS